MDEYIRRGAALSEACKGCSIDFPCEPCEPQDCEIKARLQTIPAADVVERKKGKWKLHNDGSATCSECGFVQLHAWDWDNWDNFCHHCGADMREV